MKAISDKIKSKSKAGTEFEKISDLIFPSSPFGQSRKWGGTFSVARVCFCNPIIKVLVFMTMVFKSGLPQRAGINQLMLSFSRSRRSCFGLGFLFM